ncbi:unnamed protein product [Sphagnum balticum]
MKLEMFDIIALTRMSVEWVEKNQSQDAAHDMHHVARVINNAQKIAIEERANPYIVTVASALHDCVNIPKSDPRRNQASRLSAIKAGDFLVSLKVHHTDISAVQHAIEAHSYSANIIPRTLEAKCVQDADRLDAIGANGIARCFAVSGSLNRKLYDQEDPGAQHRSLDEDKYALDHFYTKLFGLHGEMKTETGRTLAVARIKFMHAFVLYYGVDPAMRRPIELIDSIIPELPLERQKEIFHAAAQQIIPCMVGFAEAYLPDIEGKYFKVSWSNEDGAFVGTHPDMPSLSWLADSRMDAYEGIRNSVEEYRLDEEVKVRREV